ncbi:MAG: T9SS type A sorting domain-containing protein [Saprospiraceae bacterium]|nr:T9SS type A sorting domain-containing protein [Saprospiraceae bacterium]
MAKNRIYSLSEFTKCDLCCRWYWRSKFKAYKSIDTGATWTITGLNSGTLTGTQAWYDLEIKVDPTNPNRIFAGGLDLYFSVNGGNSWKQVSEWAPKSSSTYVHADQHYIHFEPDNGDVCYFGNDGGIFATRNASKTIQPTIDDKNTGFNTTLFYYGAIHPNKFSNYFLGGAQDNGSNQMDSYYPAEANEFRGGDGFWVHIDQNEPNIQFGTLYDGIFFISEDGGKSFGGGVDSKGAFRTFAAYADKDNILYAQTKSADFYRYNLKTKEETSINLTSGSVGNPSSMTIDPNDSTRLYIGNFSGQITKVENANIGSDLSGKLLTSPNSVAGGGGAVSSIDIEKGNPNHILVCYSNYGLKNNILESKDGGITWIGVEGTNAFPDIPVRWAIFDPSNASRAMIATEMGVWTTDNLDGANTVWFPPIPGKGTPLVRTNHLEYRSSDKVVMAATWGRGIWSSDVFADPFVSIVHPTIGYINGGILFESNSLGAESFSWNFGDQTNIETVDKVIHYYQSKGLYNVSLTINNNFTASSSVKILPDKELPYIYGASDYGGDFTGNDEQYGVYTVSGSGWERGTSTFAGKNKTDKSFVIAPGKQYYDINSESYLYMPNFNMSSKGIYEFSFNTKYKFQEGADGFNIEYSTDKGLTWKQLGSSSDIGWYNHNNGITATSFKSGSSYFTGELLKLTKFTLNISKLSGPGFENVAFRFAFKSDGVGLHVGGLVDDVEITKYDGELVTKLIDNTAKFSDFQAIAIKVDWSTLPEFGCKKFEIELSTNGKDFSTAGSVFAFGTTATRQNYTFTITPTNKALYFIRIKVINNDGSSSYSSVMVVKKNLNDEVIFNYYPNPFTSNIQFTFTDLISKNVKFEMFDITGRLVYSKEEKLDNQAFYILDLPELTTGKYALRVTIDTNEPILLNVLKQNK